MLIKKMKALNHLAYLLIFKLNQITTVKNICKARKKMGLIHFYIKEILIIPKYVMYETK